MRFEVYHATNPNFGMGKPKEFPKEYRHIATVRCKNLDDVFRVTNHVDRPWHENPDIKMVWKEVPRSTSVGDIVVDQDGNQWRVESVGWKHLNKMNLPKKDREANILRMVGEGN